MTGRLSRFDWIALLVGAGIVFYIIGAQSGLTEMIFGYSTGNSSCDRPFEGEGRLGFKTSYWDRTDFCLRTVSFREIRSGGVPPDGIPPIDFPQFESVEEAYSWMVDQSPVIAVEVNGEARAYPLAILTQHEIVNDEIGGEPIAVTFCPLCNSSIVFKRMVNGDVLRFGVSGNLRNSDLIMWDDLTESWWQQFTGEAIVGVYAKTKLEVVPSQVVGLGAFAEQYPDGRVLSRNTGYGRSYGQNPYVGYDTSTGDPFLFSGEVDGRLPATERVLAGIIDAQAIAYPFRELRQLGVVNDTVGDQEVVAFWQPGKTSALDRSSIDESTDVGMAALYRRELKGQPLTFVLEEGLIRDEETNSTWNVFGTAIAGALEGSQLQREVAAPHFWFAWAAFRPETEVFSRK